MSVYRLNEKIDVHHQREVNSPIKESGDETAFLRSLFTVLEEQKIIPAQKMNDIKTDLRRYDGKPSRHLIQGINDKLLPLTLKDHRVAQALQEYFRQVQ